MPGWFLDILAEYVFRVSVRAIRLLRSHSWPIQEAPVLSARCAPPAYGCTVAEVDYEYVVDGVKYADSYAKPFLWHGSGVEYAGSFVKGQDFKVRLKPGYPSFSIAEPGGWARM
jgi:hypothetical protein